MIWYFLLGWVVLSVPTGFAVARLIKINKLDSGDE